MSGSITCDTNAGEIVTIVLKADEPHGVNFVKDSSGNAAVVHSFERLPNGKFGPIQKHGGVHYGDVLFEINDVSVMYVSHNEVMKKVTNSNVLKRSLKFMNAKEYYRIKKSKSTRAVPQENKMNFFSAIKGTRMSEQGSKKFTEYEIACQYRLTSMKVQKEIIYQWSVWKRYSEFEQLHQQIKKSLGWQMDSIDLPKPYTFVMNKLAPEFVEKRRIDLREYWQKVISIDKVADFAKHHCSSELKNFVELEENTRQEVAPTADMVDNDKLETASEAGSAQADGRRGSRRGTLKSSRRMSARAGSSRSLKSVSSQKDASEDSNGYSEKKSGGQETNGASSPKNDTSPPPPPPPPAAPVAPVVAENEDFFRFRKMRDMLPEGAVRQKMTGEGYAPGDIDAFLERRVDSLPPPGSGGGAVAPAAPPAPAARPPPPAAAPAPPPRPPAAPAAPPAPARASAAPSAPSGTKPPPATGARANLLSSIAARRID